MDQELFQLLQIDGDARDFDHVVIGERLKRHAGKLRVYDDYRLLPYHVTKRCERRAAELVRRRLKRAGMVHLDEKAFEKIKDLIGGVPLVGRLSEHQADEAASKIHEEFPWLAAATENVWHSMRRTAARGEPVKLGPLLLAGPAGLGKTAWSHFVPEAIQTPIVDVDASSGAGQFALVGLERGWSSAEAGRVVRALVQHQIGNPLVFVDELDKSKELRSKRGRDVSFTDALLPLLEPQSARRWTCPYYSMILDLTRISWIFAANDLDLVPEVLRSRIEMIRLEAPSFKLIAWFLEREAVRAGPSDAATEAALAALEVGHARLCRPLGLRDAKRIVR
ncbi:MAG: AAA family ATPase [Pseudomonadota bacterium]